MPFGLTLSILLHGGALAWAYLAMLSTPPLKPPEPEPITVALITPSELLALKKGSETATELEAKAKEEPKPEVSKVEAEKPKPIVAPELPVEPTPPEPPEKTAEASPPEPPKQEPPPKPDPIAEKLAALPVEQPPPGPTPDELKKIEDEKRAEEQRQAEEKRKAEEEKKKAEEAKKKKAEEEKKKKEQERKKKLAEQKRKEQEKKKKQEQADRLAALLDKDPTRKGAPNSATQPQNPTDYTGPTAGAREGDAPVLSVREQDLLRSQISAQLRQCWKLPGGGGGIETMVVTVRWRLYPDGSLDGEPAIEAPQSGPVFQIAAEAAVRAVKACSPFTLPQDKYWAWKSIIWDFDPREML
ncbi:protein TolA [Hyphomicrobium sp.]|uniref:protein TolA n=1 Tax=Hyphomicrobium sp. TaxID=82 RepID=UPI0025BE574F|nr:protein TolA [Hyphomicrobium sp.]MCC7253211.1 protein TolA [Hyphomicrobium sp.]